MDIPLVSTNPINKKQNNSFLKKICCCFSYNNFYLEKEQQLILEMINKNKEENKEYKNNFDGTLDGLFIIKLSKNDDDILQFMKNNKKYISSNAIKIAINCHKFNICLITSILEIFFDKIEISDIKFIIEHILSINFNSFIKKLVCHKRKIYYHGIFTFTLIFQLFKNIIDDSFLEYFFNKILSHQKYKFILNQFLIEMSSSKIKVPLIIRDKIIYYANIIDCPNIIKNLEYNLNIL